MKDVAVKRARAFLRTGLSCNHGTMVFLSNVASRYASDEDSTMIGMSSSALSTPVALDLDSYSLHLHPGGISTHPNSERTTDLRSCRTNTQKAIIANLKTSGQNGTVPAVLG